MSFQNFLFAQDQFTYNSDVTEIRTILSKNDFQKFNSKFENGYYLIASKASIGVMIINGYKGFGISTKAKVSGDNKKTILDLKSTFRPEYVLISMVFVLSFTIGLFHDFGFNILWIVALFIITFFWFRMILQLQEKTLHNNINSYLKNLNS